MIPGVVQAPDAPPNQIVDERTLVIYPVPGPMTPSSHSGKNGNPVWTCEDVIVIEWIMLTSPDNLSVLMSEGLPVFDRMRDTVASEFRRNAYGNTAFGVQSIDTDHFGDMSWGDGSSRKEALGFRLMVNVQHGFEVSAGRAS